MAGRTRAISKPHPPFHDPLVSGINEVNGSPPILLVGSEILGDRTSIEVVEWHEEFDAIVVTD